MTEIEIMQGFMPFASWKGEILFPSSKFETREYPVNTPVAANDNWFCETYQDAVQWANELAYPLIAAVVADGPFVHVPNESRDTLKYAAFIRAAVITRTGPCIVLTEKEIKFSNNMISKALERGFTSLAREINERMFASDNIKESDLHFALGTARTYDVMQQLVNTFGVPDYFDVDTCFQTACARQEWDTAKFVFDSILPQVLPPHFADATIVHSFRHACKSDDTSAAEWFISSRTLRRVIQSNVDKQEQLRLLWMVCQAGNLPILQFLHQMFVFTKDIIGKAKCMRAAQKFNHAPVARWLHVNFDIPMMTSEELAKEPLFC